MDPINYISIDFAVFLVVTVILYYCLPRKFRGMVLLAASLYFYLSFDLRYLLYLLFVAGSTFVCAKYVDQSKKGKMILTGCIVINALLWFGIKELSWLTNLVNSYLKFKPGLVAMPLIFQLVPVGISYYILQAISYLVDVFKGKIPREEQFWKYLLYLCYFPAVVQGPISRYDELANRLTHEKDFDVAVGDNLLLILFGLIKKLVVADRLAVFVNFCFNNYADLTGLYLYIGAVCYTFQIYTDFSGCVDICRGISGIFGIELPQNFRNPYLAGSIKEFWKRWHLSLSCWLKDYIYIPLGGNRLGKKRKYLNLIAVFFVSGLWHGAGFTYIIWGLLQAVYQIVGEESKPFRETIKSKLGIKPDSFSARIYSTFITFHITMLSWIFFRAPSVVTALAYIRNLLIRDSIWTLAGESFYSHGIPLLGFLLVIVHIAVMLYLEAKGIRKETVIRRIRLLHGPLRWLVCTLLVWDVLLFGIYGAGYDVSGFLYGGF